MTKSQKKAIEEYLTELMQDAPNYTNIAILHAHFETARHILTTLGYGGYYDREENKYVLYKLS